MTTIDQHQTAAPNEQVMTFKDWIITLIITAIPVVGLVMNLVWAFSGDTNVNKKNYAKALLVISAVVVMFYILMFVVMGIFFSSPFFYY